MNVMQEIQNTRSQIIMDVETAFTDLIRRLENHDNGIEIQPSEKYETVYPITVNPAIFKGEKPTAVIFGDERIDVRTWKMVVEEILRRCNTDSEKHMILMDLRDKISGQKRVILSQKGDHMHSPKKIDEDLYVETHYDAETLLRILTTRIMDVVHYDYSSIYVSIRNNIL
jgi:hypothetical protein